MFLLFYFLISPVLLIIIYISLPFNKKIRVYLNKKNKTVHHVVDALSKINRKEKKVLLFHAASAGEFEQIQPILNQINRKKYFIIQTFTSPTIYNVAHNNSLFDVCCYHPLDMIWQSYSFFKKVNPPTKVPGFALIKSSQSSKFSWGHLETLKSSASLFVFIQK